MLEKANMYKLQYYVYLAKPSNMCIDYYGQKRKWICSSSSSAQATLFENTVGNPSTWKMLVSWTK